MSNTRAVATPSVKIPSDTILATWRVKGRGKSATFYACVADGDAGDGVAVMNRHGGITFGTLNEFANVADDESHLWTITHDARRNASVELILANKIAAASDADKAFWMSSEGQETARKIAARKLRAVDKAQAAKVPDVPAAKVPAAAVAPDVPAAAVAPDMTAMAAAMKAAGFTALEVMQAMQEVTVPVATVPAAKVPAAKVPATDSEVMNRCDACNSMRKGVTPHIGTDLETCPRCSSLDSDTAVKRAARHGNK